MAEAAKVIENCQRDINIAFVNELALIFDKMNIDTLDVLEAAGSKWNFLPFRPGLVGGHCIGVDPFYLAQKAQEVGYHPEIILAGRRVNDSMGKFVATEIIKLMMRKDIKVLDAKVLILGFTLALGLVGLFAWFGPGGIDADTKVQFNMWLITPIWLLILSFSFMFKTGLRAIGYLGLFNILTYIVLYTFR